MGTPTATVRATKPTIGGDVGPVFAQEVNNSFDLFDRSINGTLTIALADANLTLEADGTSSDQATYHGLIFTGTLSTARTITLPACQKRGSAQNSTIGGFALLLTTGAGTSLSVPADGNQYGYQCDGVNVFSVGASPVIGTFSTTSVTGVTLPSNTPTNVCSLSLVAGDWDVSGYVSFLCSANDMTDITCWIGTVAPPSQADATSIAYLNAGGTVAPKMVSGVTIPTWQQQLTLGVTTTVYLAALGISSSSTVMTATAKIRARRWR